MLSIDNLTYLIGGRTIFSNASFQISNGQKIGLVGANGTGKSTLFKIITGEIKPDSGNITISKKTTIGMIKQDLPDDDTTLIDVVLALDVERINLLNESETATDGERIGEIYMRLDEIDAYSAPSRAASILMGLGFDEDAQNRAISEFSGGWKMRVALAGLLFCRPELLLLDEPTNHLDFEAMVWLENYLMRYDKTMIIISHDRDILNKTVNYIVHVNNQELDFYTGNYDQFEHKRLEKLMGAEALRKKQLAQKEKMMVFVERFGAKASKAKQAQSRLKAIAKMDIVDVIAAERAPNFVFSNIEKPLPSPIIALENASVGYEKSKPILSNLNLRIDSDDRIALLGVNGNGKSTFIKLISGRLEAMSGNMISHPKLKMSYFAQHQTDELDVTQTPYQILHQAMNTALKDANSNNNSTKGVEEHVTRGMLGRFGFNKAKADTKVKELSGGEKSRLLLSVMNANAPHILLFDEPTNHLDMDAREALIQALNNYNGAVILVSHDPHLVECVTDRLWIVHGGTCKSYDGDINSYRDFAISQKKKTK